MIKVASINYVDFIIDIAIDLDETRVYRLDYLKTSDLSRLKNRSCHHTKVTWEPEAVADIGQYTRTENPQKPLDRYVGPSYYSRCLAYQPSQFPITIRYPGGNTSTVYNCRREGNFITMDILWKVDQSDQYQHTVITLSLFYPLTRVTAKYLTVSNGVSTEYSKSLRVQWRNAIREFEFSSLDQILLDPLPRSAMDLLYGMVTTDAPSIGDMSLDCMKSFSPSPNSILFLLELKSIAQPLLAVKTFLGKPSASTLTNAYLSNEYGTRLTAKDTYSYISKFIRLNKRMKYRKVHSRYKKDVKLQDISCSYYSVLTGYTKDHDSFLLESIANVREWGFMPSFTIAWDLVPCSFIADWFFPIGKLLETFDSKGIFETYQWYESIYTRKFVYHLPAAYWFPGALGTVRISNYSRDVQPYMPEPSFEFDDINLSYRRILNGSAIAFQKWKK